MTPIAESVFKAAYDSHVRAGADETLATVRAYRLLEESGIEKQLAVDEDTQSVEKYAPPAEVIEIAKNTGNPDGLTLALAARPLTETEVRQVAAEAIDGSLASKWARRILRKLDQQPQAIEIQGTIVKLDEAQHLVFGWASIVSANGKPVIDTQGDRISEVALEKSAYEFVEDSRKAKAMHKGGQVGHLVESMYIDQAKADAMGTSLKAQGIDAEIRTPFSGWWIGIRVTEPDAWKRAQSGEFKNFSIGGTGTRVPTAA